MDLQKYVSFDRLTDTLIDSGLLPHHVLRLGIRSQLAQRLRTLHTDSLATDLERKIAFARDLRAQPIAVSTAKANEQHYEVSAGFLAACLGPRLKYSSCLYPTGRETLAQAEIAMLECYVERAQLRDGMAILDLGCGWGSAALYFAEIFPRARITAFSNSYSQKAYIDARAATKGLNNLTTIVGDVAEHEFPAASFDRVVSIEMFEHMKNYERLMAKIARALKPGGKLFVHLFAHRDMPYHFEEGWMTRHFFTGGTMPSADLLHYFQRDLCLREQWWVNGKHYARTSEDWLEKMSGGSGWIWGGRNDAVWKELGRTYGERNAAVWFRRWQVFYMACAELFAYDGGDTWGVAHYLFEKPGE